MVGVLVGDDQPLMDAIGERHGDEEARRSREPSINLGGGHPGVSFSEAADNLPFQSLGPVEGNHGGVINESAVVGS